MAAPSLQWLLSQLWQDIGIGKPAVVQGVIHNYVTDPELLYNMSSTWPEVWHADLI